MWYLLHHRRNNNLYYIRWSVVQFQYQSTDYHFDGPTLKQFYRHIQQHGNLYIHCQKKTTSTEKEVEEKLKIA